MMRFKPRLPSSWLITFPMLLLAFLSGCSVD